MNGSLGVAIRVLQQFRRDRRLIALSLAAPIGILVVVRLVLDSLKADPIFKMVNMTPVTIGLVVFVTHFFAYILSGTVLVNERLSGTLERLFTYPISAFRLIVGYLLGYSVIASVQAAVLLGVARFLFDTEGWGSVPAIFLIAIMLAVVSVGIAILSSSVARSEGQVFMMIPLIILPSLLLSGVIVPIESLGRTLQVVSYIIPLRHAMDGVNAIVNGGETWKLWQALGGIAGLGLLTVVAGAATLRRSA